MDSASSGTDSIVKLNIGGVRFITTRSTLTNTSEPSFFTSLLSGRIPALKDEEGYIFIDRNGEKFKPILEFLRTRSLELPAGITYQQLRQEAEFYLLSDLIKAIDAERNHIEENILRYDGYYYSEGGEIPFTAIAFRPDNKVICVRSSEFNLAILQKARTVPNIWRNNNFIASDFAQFVSRHLMRGRYTLENESLEIVVSNDPSDVIYGVLLGGDLYLKRTRSVSFYVFKFKQSNVFANHNDSAT